MNNDTTHNDTEITDEMREIAWYRFQEDQGFAERLEMAENAVDAAERHVCYLALMSSPKIIRAYHAESQDSFAVSHEQWQELWAEFNTATIDDAVASYINTMPAPSAPAVPSAPAPQPNNEGGHWVVEIKGFTSEEWEERYEGTLDMCRAFLAGAALGLDEDIIRIARPQRETDRIVQACNENESDVLDVLREHWGDVEERVQDAISGIVRGALDEVLHAHPTSTLAEGESPVAFLRALLGK